MLAESCQQRGRLNIVNDTAGHYSHAITVTEKRGEINTLSVAIFSNVNVAAWEVIVYIKLIKINHVHSVSQ